MDTATGTFLEHWHRAVATRDGPAFQALVAEEAKISAPVYWDAFEGRDVVVFLLGVIVRTIEDLTYHREWVDGRELALEFTGRVADRELQGLDLITLDDDHRLAQLDVLIRPLNAVEALREAVTPHMVEFLKSRSARQRPSG